MKRPVIGITSDYSDGYSEEYPSLLTYRIKSSYISAVISAGGVPVIIPFGKNIETQALLDKLDGIIISGSRDDIHPYFTGKAKRVPKKNFISRQEFEFRLTSDAIDNRIPVLGICGGMQLLNVLFGGNLIEDIPKYTGSTIHRNGYFRMAHSIRIARRSHLFRAVRSDTLMVNSTHHQAVYNIPSCLNVSAVAEDGIAEAVELDSDTFVMGVQYHPEALIKYKSHLMLFEYFIKKARRK